MKKVIGSILIIMAWGVGFSQTAQTGINTVTPQQALHVSGTPSGSTAQNDGTTGRYVVTPTMRIEGLNQTNNTTAHPAAPAISTQPLYATSNGDLVVGGKVNKVVQTLPVSGAAADGVTISQNPAITAVYPTVYSTTVLKNIPFTLTRTSMVYISASVGISSIGTNTASPVGALSDSKARMTGIKLQFSAVAAGSGLTANVPFASSTDSYTSGSNSLLVPTGFFWYNVSKELKLTPGTYNLQIYGIGMSNGTGGTGTFYFNVGNSPIDNVNVIAIAL